MRSLTTSSQAPVGYLVVSWLLMIPLVCFASSGLLWFRTGATKNDLSAAYGTLASGASGTAANAATTILLFVIVAIALFPKVKSVIALWLKDRVFAALAAWAVLSCLWSQFPLVSLEWSTVAVLNSVFAFYLYRRFSPNQQIQLLLMLGWFCLALSIVLSLFFPEHGIDYTVGTPAWRGMYAQKNMCSMTTLLLLPGALLAPTKNILGKVLRLAYVCLSVLVIIMTQSVTGRITLACMVAYIVVKRLVSGFHSRDRVIVLIAVAAITLAFVAVGASLTGEISLLFHKDMTLTGRTEIWQSTMSSIMKHPILGYGYSAFWRGYQGESANISLANHWAVTSAHNGFLEVWLDLGAVGVGLVLWSLTRAIRDAVVCFRASNSPYLSWCTCIVLLVFVTSADEGELMIPNSLIWILYILACIGLSEGARKIRADQSQAKPSWTRAQIVGQFSPSDARLRLPT